MNDKSTLKSAEKELNKDEGKTSDTSGKKVFLKVGILVSGIIVGIVILAVAFSLFLLPVYRYNQAENHAEKGDYATAAMIMQNTKHKDSKIKCGKYACIAGEKYFADNDMDRAKEFFIYAYNSSDDNSKIEAIVYLYKLDPENILCSDELIDIVVAKANDIYDSGDKEKAKIYYNYTVNSQNEDIRAVSEKRLNE